MTLTAYDGLFIALGSILCGLYLLVRASDALVDASSVLARRLGLSEFFVGATVIAFGTSAPELFISVFANLRGSADIAVGNIVGSGIANILLILGVTATVFPLSFVQSNLLRNVAFMVAASVGFVALLVHGTIGTLAGVGLLLALGLYLAFQFVDDQPERKQSGVTAALGDPRSTAKLAGGVLASLAALTVGSEFLVRGAVAAGLGLGVSDTFMAMTVVAVGTSMPELATSILGSMRGKGGLVIGNLIGSNLFNILGVMGLTAVISPVHAGGVMTRVDLGVFLLAAVIPVTFSALKGVPRLVGVAMTVVYIVYIGVQYHLN